MSIFYLYGIEEGGIVGGNEEGIDTGKFDCSVDGWSGFSIRFICILIINEVSIPVTTKVKIIWDLYRKNTWA